MLAIFEMLGIGSNFVGVEGRRKLGVVLMISL